MKPGNKASGTKTTERLIKDALIELYREKPLPKIKITEITEHCHVSRATFYFYFADIYDCLNQIEDEVLNNVGALMNRVVIETVKHDENKTNFLSAYCQHLNYIAENHLCFHTLLFGSESVRFRQKYVRNIEDRFILSLEMDGKLRKDLHPYLCALYSGAIVQLFSRWLDTGMEKNAKEIAEIAWQALFSGLMNPSV